MDLDNGSPAIGLVAPLKRGKEVLGGLCVGWKEERRFQPEDRELLEGLAAQAAIAIENARLYKQVKSLATLQERERLAREMHDGLAQAVGYLHFRLKTLEDRLENRGQAPHAAELAEMRTTARKAYEDIRQSVFDLRTVVAKGLGLIPILTEYLHEFSQQSGIQVKLENGDARATRFSPDSEIQLIRVIQEALANVRKHANARHAWVQFALDGDMGRVTIADDGLGFAVESVRGTDRRRFGLQTMRERAEALGGSLEVLSSLGKGTQVVVRIPLAPQGEGQ
jgi:signal transduction histidine kinase